MGPGGPEVLAVRLAARTGFESDLLAVFGDLTERRYAGPFGALATATGRWREDLDYMLKVTRQRGHHDGLTLRAGHRRAPRPLDLLTGQRDSNPGARLNRILTAGVQSWSRARDRRHELRLARARVTADIRRAELAAQVREVKLANETYQYFVRRHPER